MLSLACPSLTIEITDCKTLAPIWEEVAKDFAHEPNVLIAKVDAEAPNAKQTAQDHGVKSYPTIKYFPRGSSEPEAYNGARSQAELISFMNGKAGTHRVAGGGLDTTAGTIAALDSIIAKFTGKEEASAAVKKQLDEATAGLSDKYAEYYVKVLNKLNDNSGYVEKETNRLAGLLKKGGLTPEKMDDLVKRSNILSRFKSTVTGEKQEL